MHCKSLTPFFLQPLHRWLPPGHGLFLGNSMPIRDVEMYGTSLPDNTSNHASSSSSGGSSSNAVAVGAGGSPRLGTPVAANRGASGIDGVLSTAAGEMVIARSS